MARLCPASVGIGGRLKHHLLCSRWIRGSCHSVTMRLAAYGVILAEFADTSLVISSSIPPATSGRCLAPSSKSTWASRSWAVFEVKAAWQRHTKRYIVRGQKECIFEELGKALRERESSGHPRPSQHCLARTQCSRDTWKAGIPVLHHQRCRPVLSTSE